MDYKKNAQRLVAVFEEISKKEYQRKLLCGVQRSDILMFKLLVCSKNGFVKMSDISKSLGISKPAVTQSICRLEKKNYVVRLPWKDDKRVVLVSLTDNGREFYETAKAKITEIFESIMEEMGNDADEFVTLLKKFIEIAKNKITNLCETK